MRNQITLLVMVTFVMISPLAASAQNPSGDEAAVRTVVADVVKALNKDDLELLLAQYADDALIDSRVAGGKVSKEKYREAMAAAMTRGDILNIDVRVKIAISDPAHASAIGALYVATRANRAAPASRYEWKLEKREGRWLIVDTNFK